VKSIPPKAKHMTSKSYILMRFSAASAKINLYFTAGKRLGAWECHATRRHRKTTIYASIVYGIRLQPILLSSIFVWVNVLFTADQINMSRVNRSSFWMRNKARCIGVETFVVPARWTPRLLKESRSRRRHQQLAR
jgi:hypothetical protein